LRCAGSHALRAGADIRRAEGRRAALPVAVWGGGAAGLLHAAGDWLQPAARLRRALVRADLLDDPGARPGPAAAYCAAVRGSGAAAVGASSGRTSRAAELRQAMQHSHGGRRPGSAAELGWQRWLPIRQLTDEEWEAYQERKRDQFRQRCVRSAPAAPRRRRKLLLTAGCGVPGRVDAAQEGGLPMVLEERGRSAGGLGAAQDGSQENKPAG